MFLFSRFTRKRLLGNPKLLGRWGEKRAARYLKGKGFKVLAFNFECPAGEIDIICLSPEGAVVFVEVKTRKNEDYLPARKAVNTAKQRKIISTAKYYMKREQIDAKAMRFDVIAVVLGNEDSPEIRHYEKAFSLKK